MSVDFETLYSGRIKKVSEYLDKNNIAIAVFHDSEDFRDPNLRYLSGHPSDAVLFVTRQGKSILCPWDENLARQKAHCSEMIPFTEFKRDYVECVKSIAEKIAPTEKIIELPSSTSYIEYGQFKDALDSWRIECRENSVHEYVSGLRAQKDEYEIECTRKACDITSAMTDKIEGLLRDGELKTESDVALFIEKELRIQGCERTSFDTLAAGPSRSFGIHAFPGYTSGSWGTKGLSILDYGVCYEGYASDCTITVARGPLSKEQELILSLVQKAADSCINFYKAGTPIHDAVKCADDIFAEYGKSMPHGLGHGTGLAIHENPFISTRAKPDEVFKAGNIVTLEPGLYDPECGGCRLENDVLITETGNIVLTNSRIIRL